MDDSASSGRTNILKKIIGFLNPSSHEDDVTEEEIISMVNEGHEQGVLRASEAEMIHNIFEFGDKEAKDIMTHRKNLIAIDGEAGKGFAVVANQVNVLADQSAQAAKESATLIETSVKAVEKGMVIAGQTASQLQEVAENSQIITKEVTNIAETLETQTTEIQQINDGIEQINDVVQTNSATSEECAAAGH